MLEELFSRDKVTRPRKTMMMRSIGVFVLLLYREREKKKRGPPKKRKQKEKDDGLRCCNFRVSKITKGLSLSKEKK